MRMRFPGIMASIAMASMALAMPIAPPPGSLGTEASPGNAKQRKRAARIAAASSPRKALRSRWKAMQPKRHRNRLHVSRRTRRKHRRAA